MKNGIQTLALLLLVPAALTLGGCASRSQTAPKLSIHRIAVIPVSPPSWTYTENKTLAGPIVPVLVANSIDNRIKTQSFGARMEPVRLGLGNEMTAALRDELAAAGFEVEVLKHVPRSADDPEDIDFGLLPTRDAVLQVSFSDVSMYSSRLSTDYVPRVNASAYFYASPSAPDALYAQDFYYGADSRGEGKDWSIPGDPRFAYPNFDTLMSKADDVAEGYRFGAKAIAKRIASELGKRVAPVAIATATR